MKKASEEFVVGSHGIGYVYSGFKENFYNDEISDQPACVLHPQTLKRTMKDSEIISEFKIQECSLSDILATLDSATPEIKDGNWNIFYVKGHPSRVVGVYWLGGEWHVRGWRRDDGGWRAGSRVFSPATEPKSPSPLISDSLVLDAVIKIVKDAGYKVVKEF